VDRRVGIRSIASGAYYVLHEHHAAAALGCDRKQSSFYFIWVLCTDLSCDDSSRDLIPVNVVRLVQIHRLVQSAVKTDGDGLSFQALLPFMTKRQLLAGATLVNVLQLIITRLLENQQVANPAATSSVESSLDTHPARR
jgi:hypothetical protein